MQTMTKTSMALFACFLSTLMSFAQTPIKTTVLQSTNPEESFEDLKVLDQYLTTARIIGMGESTHGTREFFEMRHRIFKYLVLQHGYTTFFLEADYSNCLRVDRYIKGAEDDIKKVTSSLALWPWITEEVAALIDWMRDYNLNKKGETLHFVGCDMQQANRTIEEIDRIITAHKPELIDSSKYMKLSQGDFFRLKSSDAETLKGYRDLLADKKAAGEGLQLKGKEQFIFQTLLRHLDQSIEDREKAKFYSFRDLKMGENILYHLDKHPESKGFFWAHNVHVANFYKKKKRESNSFFTAGGILKKDLGNQYFIIGQEFDRGSFNAYHLKPDQKKSEDVNDYQLGAVSIDPLPNLLARRFDDREGEIHFFPISAINEKEIEDIWVHNIGAAYRKPKRVKAKKPTNLYLQKEVFDAMIFIKNSSATRLIEKEKKEEVEEQGNSR